MPSFIYSSIYKGLQRKLRGVSSIYNVQTTDVIVDKLQQISATTRLPLPICTIPDMKTDV